MKKISFISDFHSYSEEKAVASFDLFDTLLRRRHLKVNEVHDTVSAYVLARCGRRGTDNPHHLTLLRYQISDALKSFDGTGTQEPLLIDVWACLLPSICDDDALRAQIAEDAVAFELGIERANLALIDGAEDLLRRLRAGGKRVIAISDMYFDKPTMEGILAHLGILDLFDHVYVSAQSRLTKQTGDLFRLVLDELELHPDQVVHVGDNVRSDIEMANAVGIEAVHVLQEHLTEIERPAYGARPRIEEEVADLTKVHLLSILFDCVSSRSDHLYFLARDGAAIRRFLEQWDNPLIRRFLPAPAHSDLYLNRILTCWGGVDFSGDWLVQTIGLAFWLNHGEATPTDLFAQLGLGKAPRALGTQMLRSNTDTFRVAEAITAAGLAEEVRAHVVQMRRHLLTYLNSIGFFEHRAATFSDIGYSGTVLRDLNSLLVNRLAGESEREPPQMTLHLIATNDNYALNASRAFPFVRFASQVVMPSRDLPEDLKDSFAWLEFFYKHPTLRPILKFAIAKDNTAHPELIHAPPAAAPIPTDRVIDHALSEPTDIVLLWMAAVDFSGQLTQPIIDRFANPDHDLIGQMLDKVYELHSVKGSKRSIILYQPGAKPEAITLAARAGDYWIPGSIVASQGPDPHAPTTPRGPTPNRGIIAQIGQLLRGFGQRIGQRETADQIDPKFYAEFYPDLRQLGSDAALLQHYQRHGVHEQRVPTYAALIERLTDEFGPVPADFDAWTYLDLNPDLVGLFDTAGHALNHYMRGGRAEGRSYWIDNSGLHTDFERLVARGQVVLSPAEAEAVAAGAAPVEVYLARFGLWVAPWINAIDVAEFRALNQSWCGPIETIGEAMVALLEKGLDRAPALSLRWTFDPAWCRARAGLAPQTSDQDVLLYLLRHGGRAGIAPSEAAELVRIWGHPDFPACFDWRGYARSIGYHRADPADRCDALRRFIDQPGLGRLAFVAPTQAAAFVTFLGQRAWRFGGRVAEAERLFERALALGADPAATHHLLGDLAMETGRRDVALIHFRAGTLRATTNLWSFYNYAKLLIENEDFQSALIVLETCRDRWQERAPWRRLYAQAMRLRARAVLRDVLAAGGGAMRLSPIDRLLAAIADDLPEPAAWPSTAGGTLILTSRAVSNASDDHAADRDLRVFDLTAIECGDALAAILAADTVVFHELPFTYDVLRAMVVARSLGRRTVAWLGDLATFENRPLGHAVFSADGKDTPAPGLDCCPELILAARACDIAVTTAPGCLPLLQAVARRVQMEPCVPATWREARASRRLLVVPYPAASEAEQAALAAAIGEVASIEPDLHWFFDPALVRHFPPTKQPGMWSAVDPQISIQALSDLIAHVAVVVQPVYDPIFSFAGWAEAKARGIPAVLVQADDTEHRPLQRHVGRPLNETEPSIDVPETVRIAGLPTRLIAAMRTAPPALVAVPGVLPVAASPSISPLMPSSVPRRQRLLFANVFFAPQTIGGATRVMKDNIDYLLDHHSDAFEICIVCADEQNDKTGEWRLDHYRGVPVFRIATPQELNMDWRPANNQVATRFGAICSAFQPDLVHIHCLQRLGVGVAEVCQQRQIPYIITLHDAWWISDFHFLVNENGIPLTPQADFTTQQHPRTVSADASWRRAHRLRKALLGAAHRLAVSESFARIYADCGIDCAVNENGVSRIAPVPREPAPDARVHLCHIGGLEHHKGAYLIEAALRGHAYRHLHFTVVDLARSPGDRAETTWGTTPVSIVGKMSTAAIAQFYAGMNVLLAPSTWPESYGLVTREAIEHGLWVIASDRGAIGEPIVPGRNGFIVSVTDTSDLVQVLAQIDQDPEHFRQAPLPVGPQRHVDDQSHTLVNLYHQMLGASATAEAREHAVQ